MAATSERLLAKAMAVLKRERRLLRFSEVLDLGIHRDTLRALRDRGTVEQVTRGVYRLANGPTLEQPDLTVVARRIPGAVVCLISALALHDLTTQIPHAVDIALKKGRKTPRLDFPPIRAHWWSPAALTHGVEVRKFDGIEVLVTDVERSVADAFRYRNQLGLDVAIEALKSWRERRGVRPEKLLKAAKVVRVDNVIRPYLTATL
ncbi:MAG: type IV toxin-antitoxin system AbiEi family antitoxin domain-containing protein [Archangium sp.]